MGRPQDCQTKETAINCNAILKRIRAEIREPEARLVPQETCRSLSYLLLMHLKTELFIINALENRTIYLKTELFIINALENRAIYY